MGIKTSLKRKVLLLLSLCFLFGSCGNKGEQASEAAIKAEVTKEGLQAPKVGISGINNLEIGYGLGIGKFSPDTLRYSASVGVDHLEASGMNLFVDADRNFRLSEEEIISRLETAKAAADMAGINIWSVHMPFGPGIDLSLADEQERQEVVAMHRKLLGFLKILEPEVILFHPSYYLGLEERELRKEQLLRSVLELEPSVQELGAVLVLENMLGPELRLDATRERPLLRSVQESVALFARLPESVGLAVDTNHITDPEELILALGDRLKTLHIADGTGKAEDHWFPCDERGDNDWNSIFSALEQVNYTGPFMYESSPKDAAQFLKCYQQLQKKYLNNKDH